MRYQDKFISMKKIYRLACYKQHQESQPERNRKKSIADVCPFKFEEINEICKHCRWFQIIDETRPLKEQLLEKEIGEDKPLLVKIRDFEEIPYDPKNDKEALPGGL